MVCLALELVGPWVVLGFSVGMEAFDEFLSINVFWIFAVASRLLHLYNTDDKTSRLYCCIWGGLSIFLEFVEFSLLWSFLTVGGVVSVACQGFLVREACVGVLVGGAGFLLSGVQ